MKYNEIINIENMNAGEKFAVGSLKFGGVFRGFNINTIPTDFLFQDGLSLAEHIVTKDEIEYKTSYILFTENDLRMTSSGKMAMNTPKIQNINILVTMFTEHRELINDLKIERMITFDGWEVFHSHKWDLDLLSIQVVSSHCNDEIPYIFYADHSTGMMSGSHSVETNQLVTYDISRPVTAMLYKSGQQIAELTFPVNKVTQYQILRETGKVDPPSIKIIFPNQVEV